MSQKGKSILQRIKAKLSGRSKSSKRYSRDVPQNNGDSNGPLNSHLTNLDQGNAAARSRTADAEKHRNTSAPAGRTDAPHNDLRLVDNGMERESVDENFKSVYLNEYHFSELGRDETGARLTAPIGQPANAQDGVHGINKQRGASTTLSDKDGNAGNRRRSDTAESMSIPRKPVNATRGSIARPNGTDEPDEMRTGDLAVQGDPRPDSMAIPIRGSRTSVESSHMSTSGKSEVDGTQKLISSPDLGKSDFSDFDLTDTVDTDHHTYHAPAVTHEVVRPHVHEIIHTEIHRDIHNHEYRNYIQPIFEQEFLPARHFVPDEEGNLREVSVKDLEGIPGCTGANTDYILQTKQLMNRNNYMDHDRRIGQAA